MQYKKRSTNRPLGATPTLRVGWHLQIKLAGACSRLVNSYSQLDI